MHKTLIHENKLDTHRYCAHWILTQSIHMMINLLNAYGSIMRFAWLPSIYPYFITGHPLMHKPPCKLLSPGSLSCNHSMKR